MPILRINGFYDSDGAKVSTVTIQLPFVGPPDCWWLLVLSHQSWVSDKETRNCQSWACFELIQQTADFGTHTALRVPIGFQTIGPLRQIIEGGIRSDGTDTEVFEAMEASRFSMHQELHWANVRVFDAVGSEVTLKVVAPPDNAAIVEFARNANVIARLLFNLDGEGYTLMQVSYGPMEDEVGGKLCIVP